jgi:hypothetical protein
MVCGYLVCHKFTTYNHLGGQQRMDDAEHVRHFKSHRRQESPVVLCEIHRLVLQGKREEASFILRRKTYIY